MPGLHAGRQSRPLGRPLQDGLGNAAFAGLSAELSAGQNRAGLQTGRVEPGALRACPAGSGRAAQSPRVGGHLGRPSPVCPHGVLAVCLHAGSDDVGVDGSNDVGVESRCSGQGMDCSLFFPKFFLKEGLSSQKCLSLVSMSW